VPLDSTGLKSRSRWVLVPNTMRPAVRGLRVHGGDQRSPVSAMNTERQPPPDGQEGGLASRALCHGDAIYQVTGIEKNDFIIGGYRGRGIMGKVLLRNVGEEVARAALRPALIARKSTSHHQACAETRSVCNSLGIRDISARSA